MKFRIIVVVLLVWITLAAYWGYREAFFPQWEYRVLHVENSNNTVTTNAPKNTLLEYERLKVRAEERGYFDLDESDGVKIDALGKEGWELVSAVPQTETEQFGDSRPNTRTGCIILVFKRRL